MFPESIRQQLAKKSKELFEQGCIVSMRIEYQTGGVFNNELQTWTTPVTPVTKNVLITLKEGRNVDNSNTTVVINRVPLGQYGVWLKWIDKLNISTMSSVEKDSLVFTIYYTSDKPLKLKPDLVTWKNVYFMGYQDVPESQFFLCSILK